MATIKNEALKMFSSYVFLIRYISAGGGKFFYPFTRLIVPLLIMLWNWDNRVSSSLSI